MDTGEVKGDSKIMEFEKRTILLLNGVSQEYFIDPSPKAHIAIANTHKKRIEVNQSFENLARNEKLAVIYHELGHLNFKLYKLFREIITISQTLFTLSIGLPIFFLLLNKAIKRDIFNLPNSIWIIFILLGLFIFVVHIGIYWLLEIIADINSISKVNKKYLIKVISEEYKSNRTSFVGRYITHPPWKLRKKIMENF